MTYKKLAGRDAVQANAIEHLERKKREEAYQSIHDKNYPMIRLCAQRGMSRRRLIEIYGDFAVLSALENHSEVPDGGR
jgi:hypothetical protein